MNPLQYTSEEMFSSTELIRKSKMVFDKLHKKEIEKAIILRDGKPSFMLLDFAEYEKIMKEYIQLKSSQNSKTQKEEKPTDLKESCEVKPETKDNSKELSEKELEEALAEIDELDLENLDNTALENVEEEPLKEFWE